MAAPTRGAQCGCLGELRESAGASIQQHAYSDNNLLRSKVLPPYVATHAPGQQAGEIVRKLVEFGYRRGYLAYFDETVSQLTVNSANHFEEALAEFGRIFGFHAEGPENDYAIGPNVLWLLDDRTGLIMKPKAGRIKITL